jgi:hypothetical protein
MASTSFFYYSSIACVLMISYLILISFVIKKAVGVIPPDLLTIILSIAFGYTVYSVYKDQYKSISNDMLSYMNNYILAQLLFIDVNSFANNPFKKNFKIILA